MKSKQKVLEEPLEKLRPQPPVPGSDEGRNTLVEADAEGESQGDTRERERNQEIAH
jgi:hypothetical protein